MNDQRIAVITDSGTNVPDEFAREHDVRVVPLLINFADGSSLRSGVDIGPAEMIERLPREIPTTSLPSPAQIREALEQAREDGYVAAVFVTISAGLSATNQTVRLVGSQMEDFPVIAVNTRSIGVAAGMVVIAAVEMIEAGVPWERLDADLDALSRDTRVWFSTKTLSYLRKGGRITETVYRLGTILNIKPVITCNKDGYYVVARKTRGWQRSLDAEVKLALGVAEQFDRVRLAVSCSLGNDHFDELETKLRAGLDQRGIEVADIVYAGVSPDLLVHTGPDMVGVGVERAWR